MTTSFPTTIDAIARPTPTTLRNAPGLSLSSRVDDLADAVEAAQTKLGFGGLGTAAPPASAAVLRRTATGESQWGPLQASDIASGQSMTLLASQAPIGATTTKFDITSISQAYKALRLYLVMRSNVAAATDSVAIRINGLTTFYQWIQINGTNTTISSSGLVAQANANVGACPGTTVTASLRGIMVVEFPGYTDASTLKSWTATGGLSFGTTATELHARMNYGCQVNDTNAITRIEVLCAGANIGVGASFALYGVQ